VQNYFENCPGMVVFEVNGRDHHQTMKEISQMVQHIRSQAAVIPQAQKLQYQKALQAAQELESAIHEDQPNREKIEHSAKDLRAIAQTVTAIAPVVGEFIKKLWP
jgi:chemotaxis regulatin CheY-phosphate phosphatase CheZ